MFSVTSSFGHSDKHKLISEAVCIIQDYIYIYIYIYINI